MNAREEYIKYILNRLSVRDLATVGAVLMKEDSSDDFWGKYGKRVVEERFDKEGHMATVGISQPKGPAGISMLNYYTAITAPFLIRSLSNKKEAEALISFFYNQATRVSQELKETGAGGANYALFYLITNLEESSLAELDKDKYLIKKLTAARDKLQVGHAVSGVGNFGIYSSENIIDAVGAYPELERCINGIGEQYSRLVFELDDNGELHAETALLSGLNCVSIGRSNLLSKVSLPQPSSKNVLKYLEELVNSPRTKERDIQIFFERHPELLTMGEYASVYPQIALVREDGNVLRPDFLLEPASGPLCTILDLKLPMGKILIQTKNRHRFSAKIYEYAAQLREYGHFFDSYKNRHWFKKTYGIEAFKPRLILVIGKDYTSTDYLILNQLRPTLEPVRIITYEELIAKCRDQARRL